MFDNYINYKSMKGLMCSIQTQMFICLIYYCNLAITRQIKSAYVQIKGIIWTLKIHTAYLIALFVI